MDEEDEEAIYSNWSALRGENEERGQSDIVVNVEGGRQHLCGIDCKYLVESEADGTYVCSLSGICVGQIRKHAQLFATDEPCASYRFGFEARSKQCMQRSKAAFVAAGAMGETSTPARTVSSSDQQQQGKSNATCSSRPRSSMQIPDSKLRELGNKAVRLFFIPPCVPDGCPKERGRIAFEEAAKRYIRNQISVGERPSYHTLHAILLAEMRAGAELEATLQSWRSERTRCLRWMEDVRCCIIRYATALWKRLLPLSKISTHTSKALLVESRDSFSHITAGIVALTRKGIHKGDVCLLSATDCLSVYHASYKDTKRASVSRHKGVSIIHRTLSHATEASVRGWHDVMCVKRELEGLVEKAP